MPKLLQDRTRVRALAITVGAFVAATLFLQLVIKPPTATIFSGIVYGLLNSLLAVGLVLIYRSHRIINFAQAALGAAGGVFTFNTVVVAEYPYFLGFVAGILVAALVALAVELAFIRRFFNSPRLVLTVITIAIIPAIGYASGFIGTLPIFGDVQDRTQDVIAGRGLAEKLPFKDFTFQLGDLPLSFGFIHLFSIGMSILAMVGLALFLRFSRTGIAVRASAENAERARLLGINVGNLSMIVWLIAGILSGIAVVLTGSVQGQFSSGVAPPELLVVALGGAVLGGMRSLPTAAVATLIISVVREAVRFKYESQVALVDVGLFVFLLAGLVFQGLGKKRSRRSEESESSSWKATEEPRPIPKEMLEVSGVRLWRRFGIAIGIIGILLFPWVANAKQTNLGGHFAIVTIALLSLTVLTGWAGQVSLGQFAFVAVGAVIGGALTEKADVPFWIALFLVPVLTAAITLLIGIPALRIQGLFLGAATYAMAFAVNAALFKPEYFGWLLPEKVDRPSLFLFDFQDERSMYYLTLLCLLLAIVVVTGLRRSRPGRVLIALRENENNVRSFGINPIRMRLMAFGVSGYLCGFAGVLLAHHQRAVQQADFPAQLSLDLFLFAVAGGVGSVFGVVIGGIYFAMRQLFTNEIIQFIIGPIGVLALLYMAPGGLASLFVSFRDGILRIVAQRRQMIVPSLFADMDPQTLAQKLIPLAEPIPDAGLAAMPIDRRYRADSQLYGGRGRLVAARRVSDQETAAFGAAAAGVQAAGEVVAPQATEVARQEETGS
ncbi:MAG TPA: ABC transporter permease [Actinomycetota bacterium]|nr:ABC transporter permease [Actinomycetota bacterium]